MGDFDLVLKLEHLQVTGSFKPRGAFNRMLTAEIDELFVRPSHRGGGIGAKLLHVAESEFRRVGCSNVSMQLSRGNEAGRGFYRRHGYAERSGFELLDKML